MDEEKRLDSANQEQAGSEPNEVPAGVEETQPEVLPVQEAGEEKNTQQPLENQLTDQPAAQEPQEEQSVSQQEPEAKPAGTGNFKMKKWMLPVAVVVLALVVVVAAAKDVLLKQFFPREYLVSALVHTQEVGLEAYEKMQANSPYYQVLEELSKGASDTQFDIQFQSFGEESSEVSAVPIPLVGLGIRGNYQMSPQNNRLLGEISLYSPLGDLLSMSGYLSDEEYAFAVPILFDGYLSFNPQTLEEDYNASPFGAQEPLDPSVAQSLKLDLSQASLWNSQAQTMNLVTGLGEVTQGLYKSMKVSASGSTLTGLDGSTWEGEVFTAVISEEDWKAYCKNLVQFIFETEPFKQAFESALQQAQAAGEAPADDWISQLNAAIDSLQLPDGVTMEFGIDSEKMVRVASLQYTLVQDGQETKVETFARNTGEIENQEFAVYLRMTGPNQEVVTVELTGVTQMGENGAQSAEMAFGLFQVVGDSKISVLDGGYLTSYDPAQTQDNFACNLWLTSPDGSGLRLDCAGDLVASPENKSWSMTLDPLKMSMDSQDGGTQIQSVVTVSQQAVAEDQIALGEDVQRTEIFKLSEDELSQLTMSVMMRLMLLMGVFQ